MRPLDQGKAGVEMTSQSSTEMSGAAGTGIRILHVSMHRRSLSKSPGVKAQLASEWRAANTLRESLDVDWRTVLLAPAGNDEDYGNFCVPVVEIPKIYKGRLAMRLFLWRYVRKAAKQNHVVIVRHSVVDPFELLSIRRLKNVAVIHHSKSAEELESDHPVLSRVEAGMNWLNRRWARWPIGVTEELSEYARGRGCRADSHMVLPNGIDLSAVDLVESGHRTGDGVHALFVASEFAAWHGLDRLLSALERWSPKPGEHLTVHLVGDLNDSQLREVQKVPKEGVEVKVHGMMSAKEIAQLTAQVDVGIGSLALDRNNMVDGCTLKVREYLAAGLPVFSGHRDGGLPADFPYYLQVESVDIARLVSYATDAQAIDRRVVRLAAEPYISKEAIMRRAASGMFREIRDEV